MARRALLATESTVAILDFGFPIVDSGRGRLIAAR